MNDNRVPINVNINAHLFTCSLLKSLSKPKRNSPSAIDIEKSGCNSPAAVKTSSVTPNSSVVNVYVYNGTRKNWMNFDPILPIINTNVLFNSVLFLLEDISYYIFVGNFIHEPNVLSQLSGSNTENPEL